VAGHDVKHELHLPLVSTFHTLARVKADGGTTEPGRSDARVEAEVAVVGCSDAILASCARGGARPAAPLRRARRPDRDRAPGVDHAFFSPGDRDGARAALGWSSPGRISAVGGRHADKHPVLLFVGRIQPLKGLDVAVGALAALDRPDAELVVVGGPSGADGPAELARSSS
jgi:D-inositol-3-phosphate glycosyltransferase